MFYTLNERIERLRSKMIQTAAAKGNLLDPEVIEISQQLDRLLVMMQRFNMHH